VNIDAAGEAFLEREEGEKLVWYLDFAGIPTIGVGHRILPTDPWKEGDTITQAECDALLANDLRLVESCVASFTANIGQNMWNALCSLGFNIGTGAERVSSVANMMRVGGYLAAADHFLDWNKAVIGGVLQVSTVLKARRARERALFLLDVSELPPEPDA
jgi:lysozyme